MEGIKVSDLVKKLEEDVASSSSELTEIRATLLVNFGNNVESDNPKIINEEMSTINMMITVIEYYMQKLKGQL